jgi:hypothetical protein
MKQPTIEQIVELISIGVSANLHEQDIAEQIHALYNPPLKPLSELHKDREACEKIFSFFMGEPMKRIMRGGRGVRMEGFGTDLFLEDDGGYSYFGDPKKKPTMFDFVEFFRSLGYDVQPETKTT